MVEVQKMNIAIGQQAIKLYANKEITRKMMRR